MDRTERESLAAELRGLEGRRLAGLCAADMNTCDALHAPDYQLITPGGSTLTKDAYLGQIADGSLDYRRFEPDGETVVRILGPDAAVLRYRAAIVVAFAGGGDAGRFWHTDIYERREGGWQAVWSQATRIHRSSTEAGLVTQPLP
ncbi:MAG: nuclear transport factor 2 family protein [Chloroflexota bacterium]